jgi:ribosomal protein S18 acetylase RimI-like enzyme
MTDIRIRDAGESDRETIIGFLQALNEDAMKYEPYMPGREPAEAYFAELSRELAESDGFTLLACRGEEAVAYCACCRRTDDASIEPDMRAIGYVSELIVDAAMRGRGLGAALIAEAERRFRAKGYRRMVISVAAANHGAQRLYRRLGFRDHVLLLEKRL